MLLGRARPAAPLTEVKPAGAFWEAEEEHQDYLLKYPDGYTCHFVRPGWVLPARRKPPNAMPASV
jgi:peptide-methionine (S)-S-oxide reductase